MMPQGRMVNGVDVEQLFGTIDLIKANPQIGQFKFRATNAWVDGTHNRASVKDFYGALREDDTRERVDFEIDEPPVLCGRNLAPNPVEYLLVALSGCLTTSLVAHAAARGIEIKRVQSRYEGDLDLRGFLGISDDAPVAYRSIRVYFRIDGDIPESRKEELVRMGQKYSPVFNSIAKAVPVTVSLEK